MPKVQESFHAEVDSSGATSLFCEDPNGSIKVEVWDKEFTRIDAVKEASDAEALSQIRIQAVPTDGAIRITTDLGASKPSDRAVHYDISVPRFLEQISLKALSAGVTVRSTSAQVQIQLSNGKVSLNQKSGDCSVELVNGDIEFTLSQMRKDLFSSLQTKNGRLQLRVPEDSNCHINARTDTGNITNALPISLEEQSPHVLKGTLGKGGQDITLRVGNGPIELLKL